MYRSGPARSKRSEKPLKIFATPTTASVKPKRVPRQPRGPAPNGRKEKDDAARQKEEARRAIEEDKARRREAEERKRAAKAAAS